ncbi:hypothetical protein EDD18DRAFT_665707 [Armillaria luteobubalina]|uniref:Uncharacterized protein n=1 Tax=Armillaria luteobubalina TaxID=153913 RepID=A0AA39PMZ4_9AGAR|nr:hypothetical protein EDD18DRAFT_665707 [Armillaria luteobubalina]
MTKCTMITMVMVTATIVIMAAMAGREDRARRKQSMRCHWLLRHHLIYHHDFSATARASLPLLAFCVLLGQLLLLRAGPI